LGADDFSAAVGDFARLTEVVTKAPGRMVTHRILHAVPSLPGLFIGNVPEKGRPVVAFGGMILGDVRVEGGE